VRNLIPMVKVISLPEKARYDFSVLVRKLCVAST